MELPFEAQLRVARDTGEAMADAFARAWNNSHAHHHDDDSGPEEWSWARTARRRVRAADAIDHVERDRENNVSPPPTNRNYEVRRRNLDFGAAVATRFQGAASANDEFLFRPAFNRSLNLPLPAGTGWENRARIREGMRIMHEEYGPSNVVLLDTTLDPTVPNFSGAPLQLCHSQREQLARREEGRDLVRRLRVSLFERRANMLQQARDTRIASYVDATENNLRQYQLLGDAITEEFTRRIAVFRADDPTTFSAWSKHMTIAEHATTSPSRQFQIAQWFTRDVPGKVLRQLRRVEIFHTNVCILKERLRTAQVDAGEIEDEPNRQVRLRSDDAWQSDPQRYDFGWEPQETPNGFSDYNPLGESASVELAKHMLANFEVRKVRLSHAKRIEIGTLTKRMMRFIGRTLDWHDHVLNPEVPREIRLCLERVAQEITNYSNNLPELDLENIEAEEQHALATDGLPDDALDQSSELEVEVPTRRGLPENNDSDSDSSSSESSDEESESDDAVE